MADIFVQLTPRGVCDLDAIANVLYYRFAGGVDDFPAEADLIAAINSWVAKVKTAYLFALPSSYTMVDIAAVGYGFNGARSEALPVVISSSGTGGQTDPRDGNAHTFRMSFNMGVLTAFSGTAGELRSSRLDFGPIINAGVANNGLAQPGSYAGGTISDLTIALLDTLDIRGTDDGFPVRVSHTDNHVKVPGITSYRNVTGITIRPFTGLRRSRTNQR